MTSRIFTWKSIIPQDSDSSHGSASYGPTPAPPPHVPSSSTATQHNHHPAHQQQLASGETPLSGSPESSQGYLSSPSPDEYAHHGSRPSEMTTTTTITTTTFGRHHHYHHHHHHHHHHPRVAFALGTYHKPQPVPLVATQTVPSLPPPMPTTTSPTVAFGETTYHPALPSVTPDEIVQQKKSKLKRAALTFLSGITLTSEIEMMQKQQYERQLQLQNEEERRRRRQEGLEEWKKIDPTQASTSGVRMKGDDKVVYLPAGSGLAAVARIWRERDDHRAFLSWDRGYPAVVLSVIRYDRNANATKKKKTNEDGVLPHPLLFHWNAELMLPANVAPEDLGISNVVSTGSSANHQNDHVMEGEENNNNTSTMTNMSKFDDDEASSELFQGGSSPLSSSHHGGGEGLAMKEESNARIINEVAIPHHLQVERNYEKLLRIVGRRGISYAVFVNKQWWSRILHNTAFLSATKPTNVSAAGSDHLFESPTSFPSDAAPAPASTLDSPDNNNKVDAALHADNKNKNELSTASKLTLLASTMGIIAVHKDGGDSEGGPEANHAAEHASSVMMMMSSPLNKVVARGDDLLHASVYNANDHDGEDLDSSDDDYLDEHHHHHHSSISGGAWRAASHRFVTFSHEATSLESIAMEDTYARAVVHTLLEFGERAKEEEEEEEKEEDEDDEKSKDSSEDRHEEGSEGDREGLGRKSSTVGNENAESQRSPKADIGSPTFSSTSSEKKAFSSSGAPGSMTTTNNHNNDDGLIASATLFFDGRDEEWDADYRYNSVDDPKIKHGKHRVVQNLPGALISVLPYTKTKVLREDVNSVFRDLHPKLPSDLTLSMIRRLKREITACIVGVNAELSTAALAFVYLEKLVLKGVVRKANRKIVAGACLSLAVKFNEGLEVSTLRGMLSTFVSNVGGVTVSEIFRNEFLVFAHLKFKLELEGGVYAEHFFSLLRIRDLAPHQYLGGEAEEVEDLVRGLMREQKQMREEDEGGGRASPSSSRGGEDRSDSDEESDEKKEGGVKRKDRGGEEGGGAGEGSARRRRKRGALVEGEEVEEEDAIGSRSHHHRHLHEEKNDRSQTATTATTVGKPPSHHLHRRRNSQSMMISGASRASDVMGGARRAGKRGDEEDDDNVSITRLSNKSIASSTVMNEAGFE